MAEFMMEYQEYIFKIVIFTIILSALTIGNIAGRTYFNTKRKKELFDKGRFLNGIFKGFLVLIIIITLTGSYLGFIYVDMIDESLIDPLLLLYAVAIINFGKLIITLADIFEFDLSQLKTQKLPKEIEKDNEVLSNVDKSEEEYDEDMQALLDDINDKNTEDEFIKVFEPTETELVEKEGDAPLEYEVKNWEVV